MSSEARAALFDDVYRLNIWQDNRLGMTACPSSGCGSAPEATGLAREALVEAIKVFAVRSISELGCGDHTWLGEVKLESMGCSYVGTDISRVVVEVRFLRASCAFVSRCEGLLISVLFSLVTSLGVGRAS